MVSKTSKNVLQPEDYAFLQAKGAFELECEELRNELIDLYFDRVYPILPIIDPTEFLEKYELQGPSNLSALLLQSIFFAASSVRPPLLWFSPTHFDI